MLSPPSPLLPLQGNAIVGKTLTFAREGRLVLKGLSKGQKVEIRWTERNQDTGKVASYIGGQKRGAASEFNCHDNVSNTIKLLLGTVVPPALLPRPRREE